MKKNIFAMAMILCLGVFSFAHEGHETPGALPPAPNGGKLAEASHDEKGEHKHEGEELEIFVEAKLTGSQLKVFVHALDGTSFKTRNPGEKLSLVEMKVEQPRSKKTSKVEIKVVGNHWEADIGAIKDRRILVHVTLKDDQESKTAKIQIEK